MDKIALIDGIAAPLLVDNVSTDIISPSELYLKPRSAYAAGLLGPWRYNADGADNPEFVLNRPRFAGASILVAGSNFGCGSSRQLAVWCLQDSGFRCVIAPSLGDIFSENSFKSGLLVVELPLAEVEAIAAELETATTPSMQVDLLNNRIVTPTGRVISFQIDPFRRKAYLEGLDELDMILREDKAIDAFQQRQRAVHAWVVPDRPADTSFRLPSTAPRP